MTTLLISPDELRGELVEVGGRAYRHLFRARRLAAGDPLRLVDGRGRARHGRVETVDRRRATVRLGAEAPANEPARRLELLVAAPRAPRLAWLVEKATEVGVAAVRLLDSERAGRKPAAATLERLTRVAAAAVEQCGRSCLPEISGPHPWGDMEALLAGGEGWFLDPQGMAPASGAPGPRVALAVGPEGGWSAAERERLLACGCRSLGLGPTILRVETAAVVGAACVLLR